MAVTLRRPARLLVLGAVLCALTVALWWAVLPADWSVVPTGEPDRYDFPLDAGQGWTVVAGLAVLGVVAGLLRHPFLPLPAVALPAVLLWCAQASAARVVGANLWAVGVMGLVPVAVVGALVTGGTGVAVHRGVVRRRPS